MWKGLKAYHVFSSGLLFTFLSGLQNILIMFLVLVSYVRSLSFLVPDSNIRFLLVISSTFFLLPSVSSSFLFLSPSEHFLLVSLFTPILPPYVSSLSPFRSPQWPISHHLPSNLGAIPAHSAAFHLIAFNNISSASSGPILTRSKLSP